MKLLVSTTYRAARQWFADRPEQDPRDYAVVTVSSPYSMMGYRFREEDVSYTGEWELPAMSSRDRRRWHTLRHEARARARLSR